MRYQIFAIAILLTIGFSWAAKPNSIGIKAGPFVAGKFNPAIFSSAWLALNKIVQPGQAETAIVEVNFQQISSYLVG